jgi:hypothetical protein
LTVVSYRPQRPLGCLEVPTDNEKDGLMLTAAIAQEVEDGCAPAAVTVMHAVADGLTERGLDIRGPAWEETHVFKVTNVLGALCEITISESGSVILEYRPVWDSRADPERITAMVLELLGAGVRQGARPAGGYRGRTLMGTVGIATRQCGMNARLRHIGRDDSSCEVYAEVEVSNPARPDLGTACVTDDNAVLWECHFNDSAQGIRGIDPQEIAETIARSLPGDTRISPVMAVRPVLLG